MIINKKVQVLSGKVEYSVEWDYKDYVLNGEDPNDEFLEYKSFTNLNELLIALSDDKKEEIRKHYDAKYVKVIGISFHGVSDDEDAQVNILISDNKVNGWINAKINNSDIDSRLLKNVEQIIKIAANILEGCPVSYK